MDIRIRPRRKNIGPLAGPMRAETYLRQTPDTMFASRTTLRLQRAGTNGRQLSEKAGETNDRIYGGSIRHGLVVTSQPADAVTNRRGGCFSHSLTHLCVFALSVFKELCA